MPNVIWRKNWEGNVVNVMDEFVLNEYLAYPYASHDDALDALSKITDDQVLPFLSFPSLQTSQELLEERIYGKRVLKRNMLLFNIFRNPMMEKKPHFPRT